MVGGPREDLSVEASVQGTRAKEGSESSHALGEGRGRPGARVGARACARLGGDNEAGMALDR